MILVVLISSIMYPRKEKDLYSESFLNLLNACLNTGDEMENHV